MNALMGVDGGNHPDCFDELLVLWYGLEAIIYVHISVENELIKISTFSIQ